MDHDFIKNYHFKILSSADFIETMHHKAQYSHTHCCSFVVRYMDIPPLGNYEKIFKFLIVHVC